MWTSLHDKYQGQIRGYIFSLLSDYKDILVQLAASLGSQTRLCLHKIKFFFFFFFFKYDYGQAVVVHTFIPALRRQRQGGSLWVWGHLGLQSELQKRQGYTETLSWKTIHKHTLWPLSSHHEEIGRVHKLFRFSLEVYLHVYECSPVELKRGCLILRKSYKKAVSCHVAARNQIYLVFLGTPVGKCS